ncbi:hypothetical protein E2C01_042469 [Portunus trituberculatus]|uniref:Uncharacterized protein n=1 Tax=Portunus trituberculatus TaxID=210409 RepID=A0A5B7FTJ1_PORTR|nr:hypothetical protein [Portunus trituberculatus]
MSLIRVIQAPAAPGLSIHLRVSVRYIAAAFLTRQKSASVENWRASLSHLSVPGGEEADSQTLSLPLPSSPSSSVY